MKSPTKTRTAHHKGGDNDGIENICEGMDEIEDQGDGSAESSSASSLDEFIDGLVSTRRTIDNEDKKKKKKKKQQRQRIGWLHQNYNTIRHPHQHLTSMEGLICNADTILDHAMNNGPLFGGIGKSNFTSCAGICIVSAIQVAAVPVSGSTGTGIFMKHNCIDNTWSNPVACGFTSVGVGLSLGATMKDAVIFMADYEAVESFYQQGFRVGGEINLTVGGIGRSVEGHVGTSPTGTSATYTISSGHGFFVGASLDGDVIGPKHDINVAFYGGTTCDTTTTTTTGGSPSGILCDSNNSSNNNSKNRHVCNPAHIVDGTIPFPRNKSTVIDALKEKLTICAAAGDGPGGMDNVGIGQQQQQKQKQHRHLKGYLPETVLSFCYGDPPRRQEQAATERLQRLGRRLTKTELSGAFTNKPPGPVHSPRKQQDDDDDDDFVALRTIENQPPHQAIPAKMGPPECGINSLMTSSLIANVEPDWQSTRDL